MYIDVGELPTDLSKAEETGMRIRDAIITDLYTRGGLSIDAIHSYMDVVAEVLDRAFKISSQNADGVSCTDIKNAPPSATKTRQADALATRAVTFEDLECG